MPFQRLINVGIVNTKQLEFLPEMEVQNFKDEYRRDNRFMQPDDKIL